MNKILSVAADLNHITHPIRTPNLIHLRKPTLAARIGGIVCLILTVPLTLGILTGLYFYWAKRKVTLIDNSRADKVNKVVSQVFGKGVAQTPGTQRISKAASSLLSGKKKQATEHLASLADKGELTLPVKEALLEMVITNDQVSMVEELANRFVSDEFPIEKFPLHKARSGKMVEELIRLGVPVNGYVDEKNRRALHYASSVEVARALVKNGAGTWGCEDKDGLSPFSTVTDAEVLKAILFEDLEVHHVPNEERAEITKRFFSDPFGQSMREFRKISGEPGREDDTDHLRNNMKALLSCMKPETVVERDDWLLDCIYRGEPELVSQLIESGVKVNKANVLGAAIGCLLHPFSPEKTEDTKKIIEILIDKGADVNAKEGDGRPLDLCLRIGDPVLLQKLIDLKVNLNPSLEGDEESPLEHIMSRISSNFFKRDSIISPPPSEEEVAGAISCLRILLDKGINVKLGESREFDFLENCILYGVPHEIVKDLVAKGVAVNARRKSRPLLDTALQTCLSLRKGLPDENKAKEINNLRTIIKILIDGGAKASYSSLFDSVDSGDPILVSLFLLIQPVDGDPIHTETPLEKAVFNLMQADLQRKLPGNPNPPSIEAINERKLIVQLLIEKGASMTHKPLLIYVEAITGLQDIYELLKKHGAT